MANSKDCEGLAIDSSHPVAAKPSLIASSTRSRPGVDGFTQVGNSECVRAKRVACQQFPPSGTAGAEIFTVFDRINAWESAVHPWLQVSRRSPTSTRPFGA